MRQLQTNAGVVPTNCRIFHSVIVFIITLLCYQPAHTFFINVEDAAVRPEAEAVQINRLSIFHTNKNTTTSISSSSNSNQSHFQLLLPEPLMPTVTTQVPVPVPVPFPSILPTIKSKILYTVDLKKSHPHLKFKLINLTPIHVDIPRYVKGNKRLNKFRQQFGVKSKKPRLLCAPKTNRKARCFFSFESCKRPFCGWFSFSTSLSSPSIQFPSTHIRPPYSNNYYYDYDYENYVHGIEHDYHYSDYYDYDTDDYDHTYGYGYDYDHPHHEFPNPDYDYDSPEYTYFDSYDNSMGMDHHDSYDFDFGGDYNFESSSDFFGGDYSFSSSSSSTYNY